MENKSYKVPLESEGARLDLFLVDLSVKHELGLSRTAIQKLIAEGKVFLDAAVVLKAHVKVKPGEKINFALPEKKDSFLKAEKIPLEIVYEDEDLAIINKQPGLVVHPAPGNFEHTLVNALLENFKELSDINPGRPGIVHRLDKETSGLLVIAKNNTSHLNLAKQFAEHTINRVYLAIVRGRMEFDEDVIEAPIGRHLVRRKSMAVSFHEHTRYAKTYYRTLKRGKDFSLLELKPFTGRTHQLRVHLAFIGYPILGDEKYGRKSEFSRLALHALSLGFIHPRTNKQIDFKSSVPPEFTEFLNKNLPKEKDDFS